MGTKNNPGEFDCYADLDPDEPHFVLRATDPQAPALLRKWASDRDAKLPDRIRYLGGDSRGTWEQPDADYVARQQAKIAEARYCAAQMEVWAHEHRGDD